LSRDDLPYVQATTDELLSNKLASTSTFNSKNKFQLKQTNKAWQ